jgi:hypothetical protein
MQPVKDEPLINLNYRPRWGFRLLIFICIFMFYYIFAIVTFRLPFSYYKMSFGGSALLAGLHFIFINRVTKSMFATKYRQYGFWVVVYYFLALAGMSAHHTASTSFKDYTQSDPEISQACGYELNNYFLSHPRPDVIQDDTAFNILRGMVSKFPEGHYHVKRLWNDGIYWYTSLWLLIIFLGMYIQSRIRFYLKTKIICGAISKNTTKTFIGRIIDHGRLAIAVLAVIVIIRVIPVVIYSKDLGPLAMFLIGFLLLIFIMTFPCWLYDRLNKTFQNDGNMEGV